MNTGLD